MIDATHLRNILGHYPTGVSVVTAIDEVGEPAGMVVGSFTSVSLDPPLIAYFASRTSGSYAKLQSSSHFCVNVLAHDQRELCQRFSRKTGNKFDGTRWAPSPSGSPILDGVLAWIDCEVDSIVPAGDHWMVMGRITGLGVANDDVPMVFARGSFGCFAESSSESAGLVEADVWQLSGLLGA